MDPYQELTLYQRSAVLMAAAKLGIFAALAGGAATPAEAAQKVSAPLDTVARLLEALAASQYISRDRGRYALNNFSKTFLSGGPGGMKRLAWKEHLFYTAWSRLDEAITSGNALFPSYAERVAKDLPSVENFLLALNDIAETAAPGVIATGAFQSARTILDLGGGGGGYAAALANALPSVPVTLADLPQILPIALGYLKEKGLADRIELVDADFRKENCGIEGRTFDAVFLSHVLHDFDAAGASAIIARAASLVKRGGKLIVLDVLVPNGGHQNPVEALFDLMMLVEVPQGRTHRLSDVGDWLQAAGMASSKSHKLYFGTLVESVR
jgi:ubiquinone/menaquinone biosynthesis C-methylase UbiE